MVKKITAGVLALLMVFGAGVTAAVNVVPDTAVNVSAETLTYEDYEYNMLDDGTVEISKYVGEGGDVEIPSAIDGKSVTSIGASAFYSCSFLKKITIPDSVTSIGDRAFYHCTRLTSITIPDSVTSIDEWAFCGCTSLTDIKLPDSITSISCGVFASCTSLTGITIPDNVTAIEERAFYRSTGLTNITIPGSVKIIESLAFYGCTSLTDILVDTENSVYSSEDGVLYDKDKINLITCPPGKKEIILPDSVKCICNRAFSGCASLTDVTIPDGVVKIELFAFEDCTGLTSITIPASVTSMGCDVFYGIKDLLIYCYKGTAGERYAIDNGHDYILIEPNPDTPAVSGSIKFAGNTDDMKAKMTAKVTNADGISYNIEVNEDGTFSISHISNGDYTLTVSADGYVPRDEKITIDGNPFELALTLCKPGDIDGSGRVDITDVTTAIASVRGVRKLDTYATKVGNVADADDKLDITDVTRLISHVRGVRPL